jgi:hypothetical protein
MPVTVPTLAPPPIPTPATTGAATAHPPPAPSAPAAAAPVVPPAAPIVPPTIPKPDTAAVLPPAPPVPAPAAPSVLPVPTGAPVKTAAPVGGPKSISAVPAPLPTSVTAEQPAREELKWQQSSEPAPARPGTWAPAGDAAPLPTVPVEQTPGWQTGRAKAAPVVRAQQPDSNPDPVGTLIKQMCQGRAEGVEIRWTGTKKLQVCFEIRTAEAAQKLVSEISKRPELTAYQVDFCVLVK